VLRLDLLAGDTPAMFAVGALWQQTEKLLEVGQRQRRLLADFDVGKVVVPDTLGWLAFGEEEQVGLDARPCLRFLAGDKTSCRAPV
jgi:hypothetical protein